MVRRALLGNALAFALVCSGLVGVQGWQASSAYAAQPTPGHTALVPNTPRTGQPRITTGEIWDIEVIGNRVFVAGTFTSITDSVGSVTQRYLVAYDYTTGRIDRTFRPTFNNGVSAVEASPDGTKLFVAGSFNTVNGVAMQKVASLNLSTGAPLASFAFTRSTNNQVTALEATNDTVYVGGKFTRVNGVLLTGLAAANATTGAIDTGFDNQISGGIGVDGTLTVQQLRLTHDESKLLVVHTGRRIDGQDRLGMALIDTSTKQLLPWRSRLWDDNIARVGGVTRIYAADIAPNDEYFVVTSGSGGDFPPISDTAIAYPISGGDNVQPLWISRAFDSIYSVAITEVAVYIGGHFAWIESPTANQPWPGLDNVGYGTGQGLSGYGLGDQVVRREHLGALDPATGTALEWNSWSNSFEGNKAMLATRRGLFVGGDGNLQGTKNVGRIGFYDLTQLPAATTTNTTIEAPIEGRVFPAGAEFELRGNATSPQGINRVQVEIQDTISKQYLQDDLTTWGRANSINATLGTGTTSRSWSLRVTLPDSRTMRVLAKTFGTGRVSDPSKAEKKFETFLFGDQTPATGITGPIGIQTSTTFTMTGTATDDNGISALSYWFRDEDRNYLQNDGSVAPIFNSFRGTPDVVGAPSATWSYEVTLPHEGIWRGSATAIDDAGQADLRSAVRDFVVDSDAQAPNVTITAPASMTPPLASPTVVVAPGGPLTFSGTATDELSLRTVEILLRNTTTREALSADGTWGMVSAGWRRLGPVDISGSSYNWTFTTPFNLTPGTYTFSVRATDDQELITPTTLRGNLTISAQVPGDSPPDGLLTGSSTTPYYLTSPDLGLSGTATDDKGVKAVKVVVFDQDTGRYLHPNGQLQSGYTTLDAGVASPNATSTSWSLPLVLPGAGDYNVTVLAYDTVDQQDASTTGATARYYYYPGDAPPGFEEALGQPVSGSSFTEGRIVVTGRALDDLSIARVEVGIVNSAGQYMGPTGTFTSTTPSWRIAFLNSPGSSGSNFSYTTPVIPDGSYTVLVRAMDHHDQFSAIRTSTGVTVTHPANNPPVANATVNCTQNVCSFDARSSTDESPASLTYSWNFGGTQGTGTGPVPTKTYSAPGTFTVTLTVRDEWMATATTTLTVTIAEPAGNAAPNPAIVWNCIELACSFSSSGSTDPNAGDVLTYSWSLGDGGATVAGPTATRTYATTGTYTVTLTATDGWGRSATRTQTVTLTEPAGNNAPTVAFSFSCTGLTCAMNSSATTDPEGNQIRYSWAFGDGTTSTTGNPTKTYASAGTHSVTLTATDGWNRSSSLTRTVTVG